MNYEKASKNIKVNYGLILQISTMALMVIAIIRSEKTMYSLKNNPDFNVGDAPKKICYHSIQSIINGNPSSNYYTSEIFDYLKIILKFLILRLMILFLMLFFEMTLARY